MTRKPVQVSPAPAPAAQRSGTPSIGLALGGGGARGLAHIPVLEAFDELGLRPKIIAGTSIGAVFAAAYASGLSGKQIRAHAYEVLKKRLDLVRDLYAARVRMAGGLFGALTPRPAFISPERLLDIILPLQVVRDFDQLSIPLKIVASDFYAQEAVVFSSGPLRQAIAASMALPVLFQPVQIDGRVLIDGGLVNPLPFDLIAGEADLTVAVDASGAPTAPRRPGDAESVGGAVRQQFHLRAHHHPREAAAPAPRSLHRRRHQPLPDPRLPQDRRDSRRRRAGQGARQGAARAHAGGRDVAAGRSAEPPKELAAPRRKTRRPLLRRMRTVKS